MYRKSSIIYLLFFVISIQVSVAQSADLSATKETAALLKNLHKLLQKGILFGHQDDLAYGVNWKYEDGRSDVKEVVGEYPGLYGWDLAGLENDSAKNIDGVPFDKMRAYIQQGYQRGSVITISWHLDNPLTKKNAWDTTHGAVAAVLPGGSLNALYNTWLDKVADFSHTLKGSKGEMIPILFRPFHELTGSWFWWTKNTCTADEFKQLWQYTAKYLRDTKQVHHFIYVYNTADFSSTETFLDRYPGDDYVDVMSFDAYQTGDPAKDNKFLEDVQPKFDILTKVAAAHHKIPAFGETGYEAIPYAEWWTKTLWKAIGKYKLSYMLLWRNHGLQENNHMHYYVPYKGQISVPDFKEFYKLDKVLFENKTRQQKLYSDQTD